MSKHHMSFCSCGARLSTATEEYTGECLDCMRAAGVNLDGLCKDCGRIVRDPSELRGARCPECAGEYVSTDEDRYYRLGSAKEVRR